LRLKSFVDQTSLQNREELDRVRLLAYYFLKVDGLAEFSLENVETWFSALHFSRPNRTRLRRNLAASRWFLGGEKATAFRLHAAQIAELEFQFPLNTEEIICNSTVIPEAVFSSTRGYIERLCQQINCTYDSNAFDGCAVLMRRLLEILLVLSFSNQGLDADIRGTDGNLVALERLVTLTDSRVPLSRNGRAEAERFRELGNFSAHRIEYTCRRADLEPHLLAYRALIEELLYKSGLRR
jgi:hypothetical protein